MPDSKENVKTIFGKALEIRSDGERAKYLDQVCAGEESLRAEVDDLLGAIERAGNFLGGSSPAGATTDQPPAEQPGTLIGSYKLIEEIGEGGMGNVFMATQKEPVRRKVALKVIKPGMDSRQLVNRFEAEWQALAMMDHPNIAKVHDAGATESGRPYFVMELVKGIPITDYCDRYRLTTNERLELFGDVCRAVQHAHQKGIIHRDLKPSNILVTLLDGRAIPKVIDFGIAKATRGHLTEESVVTMFAQMIGTPMYMSPEQVELSAADVDTRSDVYSLGVLLYELLTGTTPFDCERMKEASYDQFQRMIREEEPPRPSIRLSTLDAAIDTVADKHHTDLRRLSQELSGELDWIVMRAMEKDRTRRYESASALAADVERHLNDEPVEACPPSRIYRFRKFARRNKTLLAAITAVALTLLMGAGVATWQAYQATEAESEARQQQRRAEDNLQLALEAVDQMQMEIVKERSPMFVVSPPDRPKLITPQGEKLLRKALTFYEQFAEANEVDPFVRHEAAKAYCRVGMICEELQIYQDSLSAFSEAILIAEQLVAGSPEVTEYSEILAVAYFGRGDCYDEIGELDKAISDYSEAIRLRRKFVDAYLGRSRTYIRNGDSQKAIEDCSKAIEIAPRASVYTITAGHYLEIGNLDQGIADFARAAQLDPTAWPAHLHALALLRAGHFDEFRRACTSMLQRFGETDDPGSASLVAWTCASIPEAVENLNQPVQLAQMAVDADSRAGHVIVLGAALCRAGHYEEAVKCLTDLATPWEDGPDKMLRAYTWFFLAMAHHRLGNVEEAKEAFDKADQWTDRVLREYADGNTIYPRWNRRLTLKLLREQATELLKRKDER